MNVKYESKHKLVQTMLTKLFQVRKKYMCLYTIKLISFTFTHFIYM